MYDNASGPPSVLWISFMKSSHPAASVPREELDSLILSLLCGILQTAGEMVGFLRHTM